MSTKQLELIRTRQSETRRRLIARRRRLRRSEKEEAKQPYAPDLRDSDLAQGETIFVGIPSYRDSECPKTIRDLFLKAEKPGRIFVGVCQQNEPNDQDCMNSHMAQKFSENVRVLRLSAREAKGPIWARHQVFSRLCKNEKYILSIDSHMLFVRNWDTILIKQLRQCNSAKAILTCYPPEFDIKNRARIPSSERPVFLVFLMWYKKFMLPLQERRSFLHAPNKPQPSLFWAAGFNFARAECFRDVPYDPNLPYAFTGEEITMAARLWTSGWDLFAPSRTVVFHYTSRDYRPTFWENFHRNRAKGRISEQTIRQRKLQEKDSVARMRDLLCGRLAIDDSYGLGNQRLLEHFEKFVGLGFEDMVVESHARTGITPVADKEERRSKYGYS